MDRSAPVRARSTSSRLPVPASRPANSAENSRKEELVSSLRARINALEAENRILQTDNEKLTKRCKELKERGATLATARKQLLEQLNAYKTQNDKVPQASSVTNNPQAAACEQCPQLMAKMVHTQERCQLLQQQVEYLSQKLEQQETQASVAIVQEDYTREVVSAMLGQMVERTASKFYKGRVLTLEEELRKAQAEVSKAADQVNALQQTVQVLSSETARLSEFDADEQKALQLVLKDREAALQQAETSLKVLEEGKAAAEVALETAHRELESAVTENQHLRVRVELMESAIEAEETPMSTQSQGVQTEEFVVEAAPDERDTRIEELEAKLRTLRTQLKLANATSLQAKENQDTMRRFCMMQFSAAPTVSDL